MARCFLAKDVAVYLLTAMFLDYAQLAAETVTSQGGSVPDFDDFTLFSSGALQVGRVLERLSNDALEPLDQSFMQALRRLRTGMRAGLSESWHWRTLDCLLAGKAPPVVDGNELERKQEFDSIYARLMGAPPPQM